MTDPVSVATGVDWKTVAVAACSVAMTILSFVVTGMRAEYRRWGEKLAEIDKNYITRKEFGDALVKMEDRIEERHQENRRAWQEIGNKIDINEDKESKTRHDIRDAVNTVVIQQSVLKETIEFWRKDNERIAASAAHAATEAARAANAAAAAVAATGKPR